MPIFIDPSGHTNFGVGLCDRCKVKMPLDRLWPDPNYPGLRVCEKDRDVFDPWRLPARQTERINLPFVRPDIPVDQGVGGPDIDQWGTPQPQTGYPGA